MRILRGDQKYIYRILHFMCVIETLFRGARDVTGVIYFVFLFVC
jgi:hypothetical protein